MTDHYDAIISIDSSYELDLYVSASKTFCVLRVSSTNQYFLTIAPSFASKPRYHIFKVLLSARGYLIVQARSSLSTHKKDAFVVYTVNGEEVARLGVEELVNSVLLDVHQYYIVRRTLW